jgi:hypothetical protein
MRYSGFHIDSSPSEFAEAPDLRKNLRPRLGDKVTGDRYSL